eukprot:COSAG02_NODE_2853_length_7891_cov_7.789913_8_plen_474_part_00
MTVLALTVSVMPEPAAKTVGGTTVGGAVGNTSPTHLPPGSREAKQVLATSVQNGPIFIPRSAPSPSSQPHQTMSSESTGPSTTVPLQHDLSRPLVSRGVAASSKRSPWWLCMLLAMFVLGCGCGVGVVLFVQEETRPHVGDVAIRFSCDENSGKCVEGGTRNFSHLTDCRAACVGSWCVPAGFPGGNHTVLQLADALNTVRSGQAGGVVVCQFAGMQERGGNLTVLANQALSITGNIDAGQAGPRLWVRFEVGGDLFLAALTLRDMFTTTKDPGGSLTGAGVHVRQGGRLVARDVSFLRLTTNVFGGAVMVGDCAPLDSGGDCDQHGGNGAVAEFYNCLFDGNRVTNKCNSPTGDGEGGTVHFRSGAIGVFDSCVLRNSYAACAGGTITTVLRAYNRLHPYRTNVTISNTTFVNNLSDDDCMPGGCGSDFYALTPETPFKVPCPAPAENCDVDDNSCCLSGDHTNLNYVVPNS